MHIDWIDLAAVAFLWWLSVKHANGKTKSLEAHIRLLEVQCNTNEMNVKKLYYLRDLEAHWPAPDLTEEDRAAFTADFESQLQPLVERNKALMVSKR
ncbi:hypothetical protein [Paraburkholderia sp. SUR17]|uniref:hypothetical protein n=1 Tax=Paraburkholderia sp. SUR17 TaxID=3034358 RepID=UPI0024082444|nr:hypothetical protein [Paraburkholderia sp. SUR17]WEY38817.1 hypothetical protein P2869_00060 [Paraburkholderia sp. SUR17]